MGPRLPRVFGEVRQGRRVGIPDTRVLLAGWEVDRQEFRRSGAKSHLSVPCAVAGAPMGCLTIVSVRVRHDWSNAEIERLNILARVFANALHRRET